MQEVEEAWNAYSQKMYGYALSLLTHPSEAEDALQNVFMNFARVHQDRGGIENPQAYLYRVTRHECFRRQGLKRHLPLPDKPVLLIEAPQENREKALDISRALPTLPLEQREIVVLKLYHHQTFKEIALLLNLSLNTAASRYRYGLEKLRKSLQSPEEVNDVA